jgi:hypothetical protein
MIHELENPYESPHAEAELTRSQSQPGMLSPRALTLATMIVAAAATRIFPHPWNFTAVGAMCLFGGAYFRRPTAAFVVPMIALLVSDLVLASTRYDFSLFGYPSVWLSYGLFALTVVLGMLVRGGVTFVKVTGLAIGASVMFFLVSNLFAWIEGHGGYPYTPAGLLECYVAAIPFARNMLLANLFYSGVLFGGYELLARGWPALGSAPFVPARVPTQTSR